MTNDATICCERQNGMACCLVLKVIIVVLVVVYPLHGQNDSTRKLKKRHDKASYYLSRRGVKCFAYHTGNSVRIPRIASISDEDLTYVADIGLVGDLSIDHQVVTSEALVKLLGKLDELEHLTLAGSGVDDAVVAALADKRSLKRVSLYGPIYGTTFEQFCSGGLRESLESLRVRCEHTSSYAPGGDRISGLPPEAVASISQLEHLGELSLSACAIEDESLAHLRTLTDLEILVLAGNPIKGSGLKHLGELSKLRVLTLSQCRLRDADMQEFPSLPNLVQLSVTCNQIGDEAFAALSSAGLDKLQSIFASRVDLTDEGLKPLAGLPSLQGLILDETPLSGRGFSVLQNLRVLTLADTNLTDRAVVEELSTLQHLTCLDVSGNRLTDASVDGLAALKNLKRLYVARTDLSAEALNRLRDALPKCGVMEKDLNIDTFKMELIPGGWIRP